MMIRETMDADIVVVGAGAAGLSFAIEFLQRWQQQQKLQVDDRKNNESPVVMVLEKSSLIGGHSCSGAVMDLSALKELVPEYQNKNCPIEFEVQHEEFVYLGDKFHLKSPIIPLPLRNMGGAIISLAKLTCWLAAEAEALGAHILPGFSVTEVLYDGEQIVGVRTGPKGVDKRGVQKNNYEAGYDIRAKIVVFAEGTRGSLFKSLKHKDGVHRQVNPDVYEEGVKEIIQLPEGRVIPGGVYHFAGYPFTETMGGAFLYSMGENKITLGVVGYLDTPDPLFDPHRELQKLKRHPFVSSLLEGGEVIAYGAKTVPAGGWYSLPQLCGDNYLVIGDCANLVNAQRLKGIHLAMRSGMLAAQVALRAWQNSTYDQSALLEYEKLVKEGTIGEELYKVRNFHQALQQGIIMALPQIAMQMISGGRGLCDPMKIESDFVLTQEFTEIWGAQSVESVLQQIPQPDGKMFFDKPRSVYLTGTKQEEDSPCHLIVKNQKICSQECMARFKSPCTHFCPSGVYEMVNNEGKGPAKTVDGSVYSPNSEKVLQINFTNCIHCKTCDIKCPYDNILWTPPEGGSGPQYQLT